MDWVPPKPALLGYRCGYGQSNYFYHPASLTNSLLQQVIRSGYSGGRKNETGLWIYKIDSLPAGTVNYRKKCFSWIQGSGKSDYLKVLIADVKLTKCPCSEDRVEKDGRFVKFSTEAGNNCYVKELPGESVSGTRKCCYKSQTFSKALITTGEEAGYIYMVNPLLNLKESNSIDRDPHKWCCQKTNLCNEFLRYRISDTCRFYIPLTSGSSFGDPHVRTLDGLTYTFNGLGEYVMLTMVEPGTNLTLLEIQTRTAQAVNANGTKINATVFHAFVVREKNGGVVQVEVNLDGTGMILHIDREDKTLQMYASDTFLSYRTNMVVKRIGTHKIRALFPSGPTMDFAVNLGMMELTASIPGSLSSSTINNGLLGNINGNMTDDLIAPNGTLLSTNSTEREIFYSFGQQWQIDCAASLFVYRDDSKCEDYKHSDFTPLFLDDFTKAERDEAIAVCGGADKMNCIFDYLATQNSAVANLTKSTHAAAEEEAVLAANNLPSIDGNGIYTIVGQPVNITATATDQDQDKVTIVMVSPVAVLSLEGAGNTNLSYQWTPTNMTPTSVELYATDSKHGISGLLTLTVYLCYGCNNHGSCNYSQVISTSVSTFFIVPCTCDIGWRGDSCEIDIDGCAGSPCDPLSNCTDNPAAEHQSTGRAFKCENCPQGYQMTETFKCIDIDECANSTLNDCDQICSNTEGSYTCSCRTGYRLTGHMCHDINECSEGTNICEQKCHNTQGSYYCSCMPGYNLQSNQASCVMESPDVLCADMNCSQECTVNSTAHPYCFCNQGYSLQSDGKNCTDVDECQDSAQCPQICSNTDGSFICSCYIGYELQNDKRSCEDWLDRNPV
ncbi:mucin-like protein [Saccostrea cucullata]|uniref:mucin-like protein n=1 Tax=Saccostrea cuccullata TaxID=36930 RepID=UPI002ED67968